jgi:transcription termination factor NusB
VEKIVAAGLPDLPDNTISSDKQRDVLLERMSSHQQQTNLAVNQRISQMHFSLLRNMARNLLLCAVYSIAYGGMGRRLT